MSSKRVALLLVALFCLFAVTPSSLFGQAVSTGTVAGTVTDPSGGASCRCYGHDDGHCDEYSANWCNE